MRAPAPQETAQHVRMRSIGRSARESRNRSAHFDAPQPGQEYTGWTRPAEFLEELRFQKRLFHVSAKRAQNLGVFCPDTDIAMRGTDAEVEKDRIPLVRLERIDILTEFGHHGPGAHCTRGRRKAQRYAVRPRIAGGGALPGDRANCVVYPQPDTAPCGDCLMRGERNRLTHFAMKFRDGAERPDRPARMRVCNMMDD